MVFLSIFAQKEAVTPFYSQLIIFLGAQFMIAIHTIHILKTLLLHLADTICSTLGG